MVPVISGGDEGWRKLVHSDKRRKSGSERTGRRPKLEEWRYRGISADGHKRRESGLEPKARGQHARIRSL